MLVCPTAASKISLMCGLLAPSGGGASGMDFTLWEGVLVQQEDGQLGIVRSPAASGACKVQLTEGIANGSNTQPSEQPTVTAVRLSITAQAKVMPLQRCVSVLLSRFYVALIRPAGNDGQRRLRGCVHFGG